MVTLKLLTVGDKEIAKDEELLDYFFPDPEEPYFEFQLKGDRTIIIYPGTQEVIADIVGEKEEEREKEKRIVRMKKIEKDRPKEEEEKR